MVILGVALLLAGVAIRGTGSGGVKVVAKKSAAKAGIFEVNHSYRANAGDLSGNGGDDLIFIPHFADFPRVYVNRGGGTFVDIAPTNFPARWTGPRDRHDCPIGDVDGDGLPDIFCTTGGNKGGSGATPSELWLQQPDGSFKHWLRARRQFDLGPATDPFGRSRDAVFLDATGNGHLDLYIQNAYPRRDGRSSNSRLFINEDGERYVSARRRGFTGANIPVGGSNLQAVDYNGDGWTDILACGKEGIYLFRNLRGKRFREVGDRRRGRRSCAWAELARVDRGGRLELIRLNRRALTVHEQDRRGRFGPAVYRRPLRHGVSFAAGDVTGNRLDDIYVVRRGEVAPNGAPIGSRRSDRPDAMLINRGRGRGFQRMRIPQLKLGRGDTVTAIDHDGDGRAAFVVMNGHRKARGPVQLITFKRR